MDFSLFKCKMTLVIILKVYNEWNAFSISQRQRQDNGQVKYWLTLSQTSPGFYMSAVQVFWKHWKKDKLLITSNFSFSPQWFLLF